ncbi:type-F conjugative transfer system protein TraW [Aeromonas sobria]|uniref:type-F conjugative transfer system protein TraW n=1 Tax=Aeromonas sobria TaxID=646 RepID=UPI00111B83A0|nr:type-F conjugative transfer system protein TraW [Aeromonas sobria]TNH96706.1 type-F conjugative transfer system protein TraW [Aeromonas sobria]
MRVACLYIALALGGQAHAANLGTWGDLYPITEPDMLTTIHDRLQAMQESGELAEQQEAFKERVIKNSLRPAPVRGLKLATQNSTHFIDPTFVVGQDLADHEGRVFARKGDKVNPLDSVPFIQTLFFIDADDDRQVAWMRNQRPATPIYKVILVNGDIRKATNTLDTRIYFDQEGVLSRKFALTAVPAKVSAAPGGLRLQVDTFTLEPRP